MKILGASTLKFKVNANAGCEQVSSLESGGSDKEREECDTNGPKHWSIVDRGQLNRPLASRVTCSFCQSEGVNFEEVARTGLEAEWICHCRNPKCPSTAQDKKKCCNTMLFLGNLDLLSRMLGDPVLPWVCGFIRRDNLQAWHKLFTNLYKPKSRILFWEEYLHFERINFIGCADSTDCHEISPEHSRDNEKNQSVSVNLIFNIFFARRPFTQHVLHIFSYSNFRCGYLDNQSEKAQHTFVG